MTKTFTERCKMFEQCLPDASYRDLLKELHAEMLAKLAEQPAQRKPLTVDEIRNIHWSKPMDEYAFARAIEAAHGIKENT